MEQTKKCTKCGVEKTLSSFKKRSGSTLGISSSCKSCDAAYRLTVLERTHKYNRERRLNNLEAYRARDRENNASRDKDVLKELNRKNSKRRYELVKAKKLEFLSTLPNPQIPKEILRLRKVSAYERNKKAKHPEKHKEKKVRRRHNIRAQKIAKTHTTSCAKVYAFARELFHIVGHEIHVDHICPLKAQVFDPDFGVSLPASGLHVPWNLDPLPAGVNLRKGNRVTLAEILA